MKHRLILSAVLLAGMAAGPVAAEQPGPVSHKTWEEVEFSHAQVADGLYVLFGDGGNIAVSVGDDGVYLIDDESRPLTDKVLAEIAKFSDQSVRFVVNTHWHYDHAGGNEALGGKDAVIIAHDNARARMTAGLTYPGFDMTIDPTPAIGLPVLTFNAESSLHLNGAEARAIHIPNAHTDGDVIVHFPRLNVIHAGDAFVNGGYQFVDWFSGGSIGGTIAGMETMIALSDDDTVIIPGHGQLTNKARLEQTMNMYQMIVARVSALRQGGKSLEEVIAAKPTAEWDAEFGAMMMPPDMFVTSVFVTLDGPVTPPPSPGQ